MKIQIKNKLIIFAFIATFGLSSCSHFLQLLIPAGKSEHKLPSDFGKESSGVIVIKTDLESTDYYLQKNWTNLYKAEFVIISRSQLSNKTYMDKKKYRYIFYLEKSSSSFETTSGKSSMSGTTYCSLYDREEAQMYSPGVSSGFYSALIKAYIRKLNKLKKKNASMN